MNSISSRKGDVITLEYVEGSVKPLFNLPQMVSLGLHERRESLLLKVLLAVSRAGRPGSSEVPCNL